ncbi:MAG: polyisoprenoid-binding protein [Alphaproteobacteria bacterium]|nr:polyisoprenoid-binding protein [Alphaproteobacteria bacterium]
MLKSKIPALLFGAALIGAVNLPASASAADNYQFDPAHSFVYFKINHLGWSDLMGRFNGVEGALVLDEENPGNSSVEVVIDASSVDTNHEARDKHLRSPDFFNAEEFPEITFKSTNIERIDDTTGRMTGDLTLLGVTKPVTFDFKWGQPSPNPFNEKATHTGFSAELDVKRSEWGMDKFIPGIGEDATLFIGAEAIKQ